MQTRESLKHGMCKVLTSRRSKKIERSLKKIGFMEDNRHHKYLVFSLDEKELVQTYLSHGNKDYGDQLLMMIAHQLHVTKKEFLQLIDGHMTREEYLKTLQIKGII